VEATGERSGVVEGRPGAAAGHRGGHMHGITQLTGVASGDDFVPGNDDAVD
jgi:hypothetical protein